MPDSQGTQSKALQAAHDRIRRKKDRLAAEALARGETPGITPSSSADPSLPASTSVSSLTFSASSSTSGAPYPQPSSSLYQLSLPGPLTPLRSVYPGISDDTPPLPSALGLTTSVSRGSAAGSGFGSAVLQAPGDPTRPPPWISAAERRRAKEAAGEAIGLEDELDWAFEEETTGDPTYNKKKEEDPPAPPPKVEDFTREEVLAMREERIRKDELALKLAGAQPLSRSETRRSGSDGSSLDMPAKEAVARKVSRWNPHAHGLRDEEEMFKVIPPEGKYKDIGLDAQYQKEKKREESTLGRLFGKKGKGRDDRKWEEELERMSRAETGSRERSLHPTGSLATSSKVSLPSSSSQPVRGILKQPGQPSRRIQPSFTAPSLTSLSADPTRPSPATHNTALSSASGLPGSSYDIRTPHDDAIPLPGDPTPKVPTSTEKPRGGRPDTAGTIKAANYGGAGVAPMARPFGAGMTNEPNMDRRPSLASSMGGSANQSSRNDTQTSLASANSSSGLFYSTSAPTLAPPIGTSTDAQQYAAGQAESGATAPSSVKKKGIFAALSSLAGRAADAPQAGPSERPFPAPPPESSRPLPASYVDAEPMLYGFDSDSRYPTITRDMVPVITLPQSTSMPTLAYMLGIPGASSHYLTSRRPSAPDITYPPAPDPEVRAVRRRSASMTQLASPIGNRIAHPSTFYVAPRRPTTADSELQRANAEAEVGSPESFTSLDPITRESLGVRDPAVEATRMLTAPAFGLPFTASASTSYLPLPPPRQRQQHTAAVPQSKFGSGFFARNASALNLALSSKPAKLRGGYVDFFETREDSHPTVGFPMHIEGFEKHLETYFPPSKSSSRDLLTALMPEAPTTLGRIENVKKLQATVLIRIHPKPEEGKGGRSRPGTAISLAPTLRSFMGGNSRPSTAVSLAPTLVPLSGEEELLSSDRYPAQWKQMILVLTCFNFDGGEDTGRRAPKGKGRVRESTVGPERSVAHLHLFDPSPPISPIKRPKTSETFGPRPFGAAGGYQPESEKLEVDRRPLMPYSMVVLGDILQADAAAGIMEPDRENRVVKSGVIWFGWEGSEGWFVEFKDQAETREWLLMARQIVRNIGTEHLAAGMSTSYERMASFDARKARENAAIALLKDRHITPEEHIAKQLRLGRSIWDPRINPPPWTPRGANPANFHNDRSPAARWARYEHPAMRPYREKDKFQTFDQLAFGRVGWREWIWPVPPGKESKGTAKADKRAAGKRRRRRKYRAKQAKKNEGKGTGRQREPTTTPRPVRRGAPAESPEGADLPLLLSDAILLERQLESTPVANPGRASRTPGTTPYGSGTSSRSTPPLRPLLLSADSSKSIVLPRQSSSRSIAPSVTSNRSATSGLSTYSAGTESTVRSGATFGRPPPASVRPPPVAAPTNRPASAAGSVARARPGTGSRNLPPPLMPPPSAPLPAPPSSLPPTAPLPPIPPSSASSQSSHTSGDTSGYDHTPKAHTLNLFPAPPASRPATASSVVPAFGSGSAGPPRRTASTTAPSSYVHPARGSTPPQMRDQESSHPSVPRSPSASSLLACRMPESSQAAAMRPGDWYGGAGTGSAAASSASLVSEGSGGITSAAGSMLSGSARRRRIVGAATDLAGEIKAIDAARAEEIRAEAAAAAAIEDPIDENRPRAIRFA